MHMVRYADDFVITGNSKELLENEVLPVVVEFLAERGLSLSPEKTKITHITEGFDFLGWNVRKYSGKLLIKPSKVNAKAHLLKVREIIKGNKTAKQVSLIYLLNPIMRDGRTTINMWSPKKSFARNDAEIWSMLWKWAKRRHPNKGMRWVKARYFKTQNARNWVFAAKDEPQARKSDLSLKPIHQSSGMSKSSQRRTLTIQCGPNTLQPATNR